MVHMYIYPGECRRSFPLTIAVVAAPLPKEVCSFAGDADE